MRIFSITRQLFVDFIKDPEEFFFSEQGRFIKIEEIEKIIKMIETYINDDLCVV